MKKVLVLVLALVMVAAVFVGCGQKAETPVSEESKAPAAEKTAAMEESKAPAEPASDEKIVIGLAVDQLFESRVAETDGVKAEAAKNGCEVVEVVADGDAQNQNAQIQTLINQKVNAIIVCAVDQNTIETALVAAKKAGIPVVAFDRALPDSKSVDAFCGLDSISDGLAAGNYMVEQLKDEKGEVVVLELLGALNDQNGIDRSAGFNEAFKALPNVKIIQMPTDWSSDKALEAVQNSFQANPDIKAIYAATDTQIPSIETVLTGLGKMKKVGEEGHVIVVGINGSKDGYESTVKGISDGIVVADMNKIGVTSTQIALSLIKGEKLESNHVLVPGVLYTSDNIEEHKDTIWGVQ